MSVFVEHDLRIAQPSGWLGQLQRLLARELAPSSRKFRTALRIATIATIGAGLIASCHVNNEYGTYFVWLLAGAGPMLSARKASLFLIAEAVALAASVVMARALAETPWLMMPFLFALFSFSTYFGTIWKLGAFLLLIEVVCLNSFYGVVFAPEEIGWTAAGAFGGCAIGFGVLVLFDNWLWPDPGEGILMESLGNSLARARSRLLRASSFYLDNQSAARPPFPPPTSALPRHMALLDQAVAEGVSEHRRAILLAAITRVARIVLEVDRLILTARQNASGEIRSMLRPEIQATVEAIAATLDEMPRELPTDIALGPDQRPSESRIRARAAMDALSARIIQIRPAYIAMASSAEVENFASFADSLAVLTRHVERLLDQPPQPPARVSSNIAVPRLAYARDPALVRYSLKVGLCVVAGFIVGITTQRDDLFTILITILIIALPTYGAALKKMILRIVGAIIGGVIALLTIIIVSPNSDNLVAYLLAVFIVFFVSAYCALAAGRFAYAGRQIGVAFALAIAGLAPAVDFYEPLWRIWGILLGTFVVAIVACILWPEYAGDSLLPRLSGVIRDALALAPGGSAANDEEEIQRVTSETTQALAEILEIAGDAQLEGRNCTVDHNAIVEAAGTLRRIANRLASISTGRILVAMPAIDPETESAREAVLVAICRPLRSWLDFFSSNQSLDAVAAQTIAREYSPDDIRKPLERFSSRLEEGEFARLESWTLEQRRSMLAELQSMRNLEFLTAELNRWLAQIPGSASKAASAIPILRNSELGI
jgi:uncharacterized membrane protein YccC